MPALNFKPYFADDIVLGEKKQTVRRHRKRPIKPGDRLYLYTGMRTKNCRKLAEAICTDAMPIHIDRFNITIDGIFLSGIERQKFAWADGFDDSNYLYRWFDEQYGLPFDGILIKWELLESQE